MINFQSGYIFKKNLSAHLMENCYTILNIYNSYKLIDTRVSLITYILSTIRILIFKYNLDYTFTCSLQQKDQR